MTTALAQKSDRRVDRNRCDATKALRAMKEGASLHLFYEGGRAAWRLSTEILITPEVAEVLMRNPNVEGVGDSLFGDRATSQTFRWTDLEDDYE